MEILGKRGKDSFILYKKFENKYLLPIGHYVNWKLTNEWDDYNELYHAMNYIKKLQKNKKVWFETHTIEKENKIVGVLIIVGGKIKEIENNLKSEEVNTVLLKYFHIIDKGQGYGSFWLKSIIIPTYAKKGFKFIHINSSHVKSFKFYENMGSEIRKSEKESDNKIYKREIKSFLIPI